MPDAAAPFAVDGLGQAVGQAIGLLAAGLLHDRVGTLPLLEVQATAYAAAAVLALVLLPRARHRQAQAGHVARTATAIVGNGRHGAHSRTSP